MVSHRVDQKIPGDLVIRLARPEDAPGLAEVHVRSWQETYAGLVPDSYLRSLEEKMERLSGVWRQVAETLNDRSTLLVAEVGERIVGFVQVAPTSEPDLNTEKVGELRVIYLRAEFWGRGIGKALHDEGLRELRSFGFDEAILWVLDTNERTRRWYERQG
jgi:ribosomal protein S18 acetylase RimI-like enzyme